MTDEEKTCYNCGNRNCFVFYTLIKQDVKKHFECTEYTNFECVNHNKWQKYNFSVKKITENERKLAEAYAEKTINHKMAIHDVFIREKTKEELANAFLAGLLYKN